jgi:hypothetical protein
MNAIVSSQYKRITLTHVWLALPALVLLSAIWGSAEIAPNDYWWHIRTGQIILESGQIPQVDLYTFTHAGDPWVYQAWLMQIALYLIYQLGGAPFTLFIHALVIVSGYVLLQMELRQLTRHNVRLASVITLGAAVLSMGNWAVRPQNISFFLFGLILFVLLRYRRQGGRLLWWLPLIFLVWVNTHGGFVFGLMLVGCFVMSQIWDTCRTGEPLPVRSVLLPSALALTVLAINPVGPIRIVSYVIGFVRHTATRTLNAEFAPLSITTLPGALFFAGMFILVVILIRHNHRPDTFESLTLVVFALLAMGAIRNLPWFGFVSAPVAATALTRASQRAPVIHPGRIQTNFLFLATLVGFALISLPWLRSALPVRISHRNVITQYTPIGATAYVCDNLPTGARIFNEMSYGSYMIWGCPRLPVFIDTRIELYPFEEWEEYLAISIGQYNWQRLLDQYGITHLLLNRKVQPYLITAAAESPCWKEVYRDDVSVVFARTERSSCLR